MSFLTIYTPTYQRPSLLQVCEDSVQAQTDVGDIQHLVIRDEVGVGIDGMYAAIPANTYYMTGQYVYVLQDDDMLADNDVVADLQAFVTSQNKPDVVICLNRKRGNVYPTYPRQTMTEGPREGFIDLGSYIVRRDVFQRYADAFGKRYAGDIDFIVKLWVENCRFVFFDRLFSVEQLAGVPGLGRPERELAHAR